ncbi:40S ribosomal protein S19-1 [Thelohanellus kitauei]|uniref:40S ribosomal protein S19-1 n=1 Tax=Thelohanellus kitauei TaxID=669202 RepID=A0A0C2J028_THEKT|nr:40S ribosomal protein S19-1 [Thelohanellus kitauei]
MPGVCDVDPSEFVFELSKSLQKKSGIELPEFTTFCKTSHGKEHAPYRKDWFFVRMASMARRLYTEQGMGVGHFTRIYGVGKRNGTRPKHHVDGSGSVSRKALQLLGKLNIVEIDQVNGGRRLTAQGRKELDAVANVVLNKMKAKKHKK